MHSMRYYQVDHTKFATPLQCGLHPRYLQAHGQIEPTAMPILFTQDRAGFCDVLSLASANLSKCIQYLPEPTLSCKNLTQTSTAFCVPSLDPTFSPKSFAMFIMAVSVKHFLMAVAKSSGFNLLK